MIEHHWHARGRSRTIVFLHEGLGSAAQWRDFPVELADATECAAFVYSRVGYGRSSPVTLPRPLTYMEEEPLESLLDEQGIDDAILFGHSDGGSIAIVHGASPRVRALILEAAHVFNEDLSVASIERERDAYEHGDLREKLAKYHDDVDGAFYGWNRAWLDPRFRAFNLERYLKAITAPTLVIQGADDPYGTLAQVDAIERGVRGPVERFIVPNCGHAPHREHPEAVLRRCAAFIFARSRRSGS